MEKLKKLQDLHESMNPALRIQRFLTERSQSDAISKLDLTKGEKGDKGDKGDQGIPGLKGQDSIIPGPKGEQGIPGIRAQSPVRLVDYWTKEDQTKIISETLKQIKVPKDGISPSVNEVVKQSVTELKKVPIDFKDIKGTEKLIEFLKLGGYRGGGDTIAAGANITITTNASGQKVIASAVGGGGVTIGGAVGGGTPKEILYVDNAGNLFGDIQATRDSVTHETHIQRTISANLLAQNLLGGLLITGSAITITGALSTITDQVSGDVGFSGVADLSTFGFTNEASIMGHVAANGDDVTIVADEIAGVPLVRFNASTATTNSQMDYTPTSLNFTATTNGTSFNVDDVTQLVSTNKRFDSLNYIHFNDTDSNTQIGFQAGLNLVAGATFNTFIGNGVASTGVKTAATDFNTAVGVTALNLLSSGNSNTAIGYNSLAGNTSGSKNTTIGLGAGFAGTGAYNNNTIIGYAAGFNGAGVYSNNTAVGFQAGFNLTGNGNVMLGNFAGAYELGSNSFYIDNQDRVNTAGDKAGALLFGAFNATPSSQTLTTNSAFTATFGMNIPTGQTYKINGVPIITNGLQNNVGITGGTTLIGGTAATDTLVLQGTSGNGTLTSPAVQVNVGNAGATNAITVLNNGRVGIGTILPGFNLDIQATGIANTFTGLHAKDNAAGSTGQALIGMLRDVANTFSLPGIWFNTGTPTFTNFSFLYDGSTTVFNTPTGQNIKFRVNNIDKITMDTNGNLGIGIAPTSVLTLKAGTATAGTAPLKFTSGVNLTTGEQGSMEFNGVNLFFTPTGTLREAIHTGGRGSVTLTAGTTTTVTDGTAKTTSTIMLTPTNLAATVATLRTFVATKNNGTFVLTTIGATGTETYDYLIIN